MIESIITIVISGFALYGFVRLITERSKADKDAAVLWTINRSPDGIYATDIAKITGVGTGTIYVVLARLEDSGAVRYMRDAQWPHRYRYFIQKSIR
jgi:hypothetical protein